MARKSKQASVTLEINGEQLEKIAEKMAIVIGRELARALSGTSSSSNSSGFKSSNTIKDTGSISIDESIIPVKVKTQLEASSKKLGQEATSEDKGLSDSKKKLANLFKKKGE